MIKTNDTESAVQLAGPLQTKVSDQVRDLLSGQVTQQEIRHHGLLLWRDLLNTLCWNTYEFAFGVSRLYRNIQILPVS